MKNWPYMQADLISGFLTVYDSWDGDQAKTDFIAKKKEPVKVTVLGNLTTSLVIEWVEKSQLSFSQILQYFYHIFKVQNR